MGEVHPAASPGSRFQPPEVRRRQILDAAAQLVVEHGYEAMTMDEVASNAGIAKGTVYLYYPSKQALLAALQADLAQSFLDGPLAMMTNPSYSWLDRLEAVAKRRLEVRIAQSRLYHELFHVSAAPDGQEPLERVRALIREILARGTDAGEFDVDDLTVTTDFLLHAAGGACDHVDRSDDAEIVLTIKRVQELFRRVVRACPAEAGGPLE